MTFLTLLFAALFYIITTGYTSASPSFGDPIVIKTPLNILVNSKGKAVSNSNIFSGIANLNSPADYKTTDPGPYQYCLRVLTTSTQEKTIDGRPAYQFPSNGVTVPNVWLSLGMRMNGTDSYATIVNDRTQMLCTPTFTNPDEHDSLNLLVALATSGNKAAQPGSYTLAGSNGYLYLFGAPENKTSIGTQMIDILTTLTVTTSTCSLQTSRDIAVEWPSLTPTIIKNNTAENKPTTITVACEDTTSHPMDVTVSSSNGYASSGDSIVNTNVKDLGLQLTWASSGQNIPLGQAMDFDPGTAGKDTQDLSIAAKPVATGDGNISAGDFSTDVTITMNYH